MSQTTPLLGLPYLDAAQAQKHVTHNEALRMLDAVVQLGVQSRALPVPPASPEAAVRYIVAAGASEAWAGRVGQVAAWQDGTWAFFAPAAGWLAWVADEGVLVAWDGSGWIAAGGGGGGSAPLFGVNTTADAVNRLAVKSDAVLLSHDDVTPGTGDMRAVMNKATPAGTTSLLFQTGYSGRAEFGLAGDDDWHVKVSPDGDSWRDALIADRTSGAMRFPNGIEHAASRAPFSGLIFTPGGDGQVSIYRNDTSHSQNPRTAVITSRSGDTLTLTTPSAGLFFSGIMAGVSYARIWNLSKTPAASAWVKAAPTADQLQVIDAAAIAGWSGGNTIQIGDPTDITPGRVIALDISPMLQTVLGAVFPQRGILCKGSITALAIGGNLAIAPTGISGSFVSVASNADTVNGWSGLALIPCTMPSPVSNSNLVLVRETSSANLSITLLSSIAVFG